MNCTTQPETMWTRVSAWFARPLPGWLTIGWRPAAWCVATLLGLHMSVGVATVASGSMEPHLPTGSRVLIDRLTPLVAGVHRGEVIVFDDPGGWAAAFRSANGEHGAVASDRIVKRVVAVAGDHIACCTSRARITIDGHPLIEPYLPAGTAASAIAFDVRVPAGYLFVLGDDRNNSLDSRSLGSTPDHGLVPLDDVIGTVRHVF